VQSTTLDIGKFDQAIQSWMKTGSNELVEPTAINTIKLVTYNIWFSDEHMSQRAPAIFEILHDSGADVIALQEVTYHFLQLILMQDWVRKSYYISDFRGDTFSSYGVVLLFRIPAKRLTLHQLPGNMERQLLVAEFIINDQALKVATVHLESMKASADVRAEQLNRLFPLLSDANSSVLMGDFNFCSSNEDESSNIDDSYIDLWDELRTDDFGATLNSDLNPMLTTKCSHRIMARYDKILMRNENQAWQCMQIDLLGDTAISRHQPGIFPSDHFAVVAKIDCKR